MAELMQATIRDVHDAMRGWREAHGGAEEGEGVTDEELAEVMALYPDDASPGPSPDLRLTPEATLSRNGRGARASTGEVG